VGARLCAICAAFALVLAGPASAATQDILVSDAAWCWFQDPRAVHSDGRTFLGYVTAAGDVAVSSYSHADGSVAKSVVAPGFQVDDHAAPALEVLPDGRIAVYWAAHGGGDMFRRVTVSPGDVSSWSAVSTIGTNAPGYRTYTYANPVRVGSRTYLFWRAGPGGTTSGQPVVTTSDDDGATWAPGKLLFDVPGQRPYVKYESRSDRGNVSFAFTDGHPNSYVTSIRYAEYRDGSYFRADGTQVAGALEGDLVYDSSATGVGSWIWDVAHDAAGNPVIVYATFPTKADHRYRYARWDGTRWVDRELVAAGRAFPDTTRDSQYSSGIALDHADPDVVYLSREVAGVSVLEKWETGDGGATWSSSPVSAASSVDDVRPVVPRDLPAGSASLPVVWMHGRYPGYTSFSTRLDSLFGPPPSSSGPTTVAPDPPPPAPPAAEPEEPAGAAPNAVSPEPAPQPPAGPATARLSISANRRRVTGRLTSGGRGLAAQKVLVFSRASGSKRWKRTGSAMTGRDGKVVVTRRATKPANVRLLFKGAPGYRAAQSRTVRVSAR
jgi:hypothetical protein